MKSAFILALLSLLLFTCRKPIDPVEKPPIDSRPKQKNLSKMTVTQPNSDKVFWIQEWKYDNTNRCTDLIQKQSFQVNENTPDTFITVAHYRFYYKDIQRDPYRILQDEDGRPNQLTSEAFLIYTQDGRKVKDSVIYTHPALGKLLKIGTYQYNGGVVYYHYRSSSINWTGSLDNITAQKNDTIYVANDNVAEYRKTLFAMDENRNWIKYVSQYDYTYDNKINPLKQINIAAAMYRIGPDFNYNKWGWLYAENDNLSIIGYNGNNITKVTKKAFPQNAQQFSYLYDVDGYPKETTITPLNFSGTAKATFEYAD